MGRNMGRAVDKVSKPYVSLRYERKFIYEHLNSEDLIQTVVLQNPFGFREIYHRRTVNNIYFDDEAMSYYHQNVAGDEQREKLRLRWYGDTFSQVAQPTFEIKKKYGVVGDKLSFALSDVKFDLSSKTSTAIKEYLIQQPYKKEDQQQLLVKVQATHPSLYNSYERRYFLSHCKKYRITVDYNMAFYNPDTHYFEQSKVCIPEIVLELKYAREHDTESRKLTQHFTSRLSKNSKYVRGVQLINYQPYL